VIEGNHSEGLASFVSGEDFVEGGEATSPPLAPSPSSAASALADVSCYPTNLWEYAYLKEFM
jgi:hypothetical protein